jgi:hypothetical protein
MTKMKTRPIGGRPVDDSGVGWTVHWILPTVIIICK